MFFRYYFCGVFCLFIAFSAHATTDDWQFILSPRSYPTEIEMEAGNTSRDAVELTFSAVNDEKELMYKTTVEFSLPSIIKPYDAYSFDGSLLTISPLPTVRRNDYIKWEHVEQHNVDLSLGDGIPYHKGWWCTVRAHGVKPGTGKVTAKLSWEDKAGKKYSREFTLKTITVTGENQGPKVKIIILDKAPGKVKFYIDADDGEGDTIAGHRWKIDEGDWSDWLDKGDITTDGLSAGEHAIFAQAKDDKGNEGEIAERKVEITENQGPKVEIIIFDKAPGKIKFYIDADDREGDAIAKYQWKIDDKQDWSGWMDEGIITTDGLSAGEHTIFAQAKDDKGNEGEIAEENVEITENQEPIVKISEPSYPYLNNPSTVIFYLSAEDKEGDAIDGYRWKVDDQQWSDWGSEIVIIDSLAVGKHILTVQAKDDKESISQEKTKRFEIAKNQGPKVKIIIFESPGKVEFYIDAEYRWKIDEQGWSDWGNERVITIDSLAAGEHTIFAQAKDDKGNEGEVRKMEFEVKKSSRPMLGCLFVVLGISLIIEVILR